MYDKVGGRSRSDELDVARLEQGADRAVPAHVLRALRKRKQLAAAGRKPDISDAEEKE